MGLRGAIKSGVKKTAKKAGKAVKSGAMKVGMEVPGYGSYAKQIKGVLKGGKKK